MKFIVTGGAGFIGSHIAKFLVKNNHEVHVIDDLSRGSLNNLNEILTEKKVVDLTNFEWVDIKGVANIIAHNGNITFTDKKDTTQTKCNEPDDFILKYWKPIINLKTGIQTILDGQST